MSARQWSVGSFFALSSLLLSGVSLLGCDGGAPKGDYAIDGLVVSDCASDSATPTTFSATGGSGQIIVSHAGYAAECCLTFEVSALANGGIIELVYTPEGEPCDCSCHYDLDFTIAGVPAGAWDVQAPDGGGATVTVSE